MSKLTDFINQIAQHLNKPLTAPGSRGTPFNSNQGVGSQLVDRFNNSVNSVNHTLFGFGANGEAPDLPPMMGGGFDQLGENALAYGAEKVAQKVPQLANTAKNLVHEGNVALGDIGSVRLGGEPQFPSGIAPIEHGGPGPVMNNIKPGVSQSLPTKLANKISGNINKVTSANPDELGASFKNNDIQDTYRRWNAHNPATQDQAAKKIYTDVVNPGMAANPKHIPLDNVVDKVVSEMRKLAPGLDNREAKNAAHSVIIDLYNQGVGTANDIIPSQIPTSNLLNMRTNLNSTAAVKSFFNGTMPEKLNDLATIAGRNAFSDILTEAHPEISQAIKDYGNLREGAPSMFKAFQQGTKTTLNPKSWANGLPNLTEAALRGDSRVLGPTALVGGAAGLYGFEHNLPQQIADTFINKNSTDAGEQGNKSIGNEQQSQSGNIVPDQSVVDIGSIPNSPSDIKQNSDGSYSIANPQQIKDASGQSLVMSDNEYKNSYQQLQSKLAEDQVSNKFQGTPQTERAVAQDQAALSSLENKHNISAQLNQGYTTFSSLNDNFNTVLKQLNDPNIKMGLQQAFGFKGYTLGQLANLTDPKYASLVGALQNLQSAPGVKLNWDQGMSSEVAKKTVDDAAKRALNAYYKMLKTYAGSSEPASPEKTVRKSNNLSAPESGGLGDKLAPPPPSANLNSPWHPTGQAFEGGAP